MKPYRTEENRKPEVVESANFAVPLLAACAQLALVAWYIYIEFTAKGLNGIAIVYPLFLAGIVSPICFVSAVYYFWKYRNDPPFKKFTVGLAVLSILSWTFLVR